MKNKKIFYQCFSKKQKNYLVSKGHTILLTAKHITTDKQFWCFIYDDMLDKHLNEWSKKLNL